MADIKLDQRAIDELFSDEDGPVDKYLAELAGRGAETARGLVPRRTGRLAGTIASGTDRDPFDGSARAWFGAGYETEAGFPLYRVMEPAADFVWNRSPRGRKHTRGTRAAHPFLTRALDALGEEGE